ncbi:MAG: NAD(P)-dependent oxidoreductase [Proteobacteria bacterium]|nr:NAD(P)-dependent oxidoreductase [Pseudomonadota bacterium]MDA1355774.1 NAD(P)-dependent oxidoreductase [Pseudomonadota bacterium]
MTSKAVFIDCPTFLGQLYSAELRAILPDLVMNIGDPPGGDTPAMLAGVQGAINDHTMMNEETLRACQDLKVIVFMGTGASSYIDVEAAEKIGIRVRTIRDYGNRTVAEHAVALMFAAARRIAAMDSAIRDGVWETLDAVELEHKTLGVVGVGGIGREMIRLGHGLGMKVLAWNRSGVASDLPCEECALDELMKRSDVLSLHLSLNDETTGMIDARRIGLMRPNAILVNTARGGVIDEAALIDALRDGKIAHAGLDVFAEEPLPPGHPLLTMGNVTLTAHAGFMTREASARLLRMALEIMREELAAMDGASA